MSLAGKEFVEIGANIKEVEVFVRGELLVIKQTNHKESYLYFTCSNSLLIRNSRFPRYKAGYILEKYPPF